MGHPRHRYDALLKAATLGSAVLLVSPAHAVNIPAMRADALDGHSISMPRDLPPATVLILGFTRHSVDATTAWEKIVRAQLAQAPTIGFYDMAMLAEVPRIARSFVMGRVRKAVPDLLKPNFLTLLDHESEWKQAAGFDPRQEDAAYVMLVDRSGNVRWSTHSPFTPEQFAQLTEAAKSLATAR